MSIEDVTDAGQRGGQAGHGRRPRPTRPAGRSMNTIEKESLDKTGLRSDVVTLYQGGLYHLYRYKKYTDVRLVFAPEQDIAFFGGDPDNFEYPALRPRHLLLPRLRGRQAGQDRALPEVEPRRRRRRRAGLRLRPSGPDRPAEHGGAPGVPPRRGLPVHAATCSAAARCCCRSAASASRENARRAQDELFGDPEQPQGPPRRAGRPAGPGHHGAKRRPTRRSCAQAVGEGPEAEGRFGDAWDDVAAALAGLATRSTYDYDLLEQRPGLQQRAVRHRPHAGAHWPTRSAKPNAERLREYRESNLESLKQQLFSDGPDLRRSGNGQAGRFARAMLRGDAGAERSAGQEGAGRQVAARAGGRTGQRHQARPTWPSARSWPKAAQRRSTARTIR